MAFLFFILRVSYYLYAFFNKGDSYSPKIIIKYFKLDEVPIKYDFYKRKRPQNTENHSFFNFFKNNRSVF